MSVDFEGSRREWERGYRRYEEALRDDAHPERLEDQLGLLRAELRRRVGGTFALSELVRAYGDADAWALQVVEERAPTPGWARTVSIVTDAAFFLYSRGAVDYTP